MADLLRPFEFDTPTRVIFGSGTIARLGEIARETSGERVFVVTDHGLAQAGHLQHALQSVKSAGLTAIVYDRVRENPTTEDVECALRVAEAEQVDLIVGLGGGSSMDCAKGVNFLLTNGGCMEDYWGVDKATQPMLPMIAVPTTAGTGSEAQSFALISDATTHRKMACGDKKAACKVAILDPELTLTMPASVTAVTGLDALSHAIETYVTTKRNPISELFSRRAWSLLSEAFPRVLDKPDDLEARARMLLGAHWAGAAIENSMLGAAHALANPLTAHFGIAHGIAVGILLPHVIRYNAEWVGDRYQDLVREAGLISRTGVSPSELLATHVRSLIRKTGCPMSLQECHVDADRIPRLAKEAAEQWTGTFNPRPVDATGLQELYSCAFTNNDA